MSATATARVMSTVFIFDTYAVTPVFHDFGRIQGDDDLTRCGLPIWKRASLRSPATPLPRVHAERFARPCGKCFPASASATGEGEA